MAVDETDRPRVGFIGLGVMGRPMAGHILDAGYRLSVHSRSAGPVAEFVARGAVDGGSPAGIAVSSDVVILMLPDPASVEAVLFGADGVASGAAAGSIIIDMGTGDPIQTRTWAARLARQGVELLDAPVSGGEEAAIAGTLSVMVGGRADALARARPVLEAVGSRLVHVGESGAGQVAKACNQLVVAATIQAVGEALVLATKARVDPGLVRDALLGGYAASRVLELHGARMLAADYRPGARVALHDKDARIVGALAQSLGVPTPGFDVAAAAFAALVADGRADLDHAALVLPLEEAAGVVVSESTARR